MWMRPEHNAGSEHVGARPKGDRVVTTLDRDRTLGACVFRDDDGMRALTDGWTDPWADV